jgi:hypothetical protein
MAYPFIDAPYGFKPVNLIGGQVFSGSTRDYAIAYNYGTAIYYGDFVNITNGLITVQTAAISSPTVGVFLGCYYTNPTTKQRQYAQYYPGNVTSGDITAIVCDDPDTVFKAAVTAGVSSTTMSSASVLNIGANMAGNTLTGSASTGNSSAAVIASATSAGNFRVLGLVEDTQVSYSGTYVSGTGTTSLGVSGLTVGSVLPIGTDVYNVVNGQLQFTGSSLTAASTVTTTGTTTLTVTASTLTVTGTVALVQTPEVLVKITFASHRYYVA